MIKTNNTINYALLESIIVLLLISVKETTHLPCGRSVPTYIGRVFLLYQTHPRAGCSLGIKDHRILQQMLRSLRLVYD